MMVKKIRVRTISRSGFFWFHLLPVLFFLFLSGITRAQSFTESNLPILLIHTGGKVITDEPKITADMKIIYNGPGKINRLTDPPDHYNGKIGIELRGSSSLDFPKKPFGFETREENGENRNVALLGMPAENDWILNASYNDKTLVRDALAYLIAGRFMRYAPRVRHVEVVINNQYQGVYMLTEKIKRDKNRVDIANLDMDDNEGIALTGGYIFKIDKETGSNSGKGWVSPYKPFPGAWQSTLFQFEFPDAGDITNAQRIYLQQHVTKVEHVMAGAAYADPTIGYRRWIDEASIVDYIIVNEWTKNPDAYRLSTFFYKERDDDGGKIFAGPVWDFNLGFGNVNYCTNGDPDGLVIQRFNQFCPNDYWVIHFWWKKWMEDKKLEESIKSRWQSLRQDILSDQHLEFMIDSLAAHLDKPNRRNFTKWPVLGQYVWPNYFVGATYKEEVEYLKGWMKDRLRFLDQVWGTPSSTDEPEPHRLSIFPNPSGLRMTCVMENMESKNVEVYCTDIFGREVFPVFTRSSHQSLEIDVSNMPAGAYILRVVIENHWYVEKMIVQ